jgi:hypothetical protein
VTKLAIICGMAMKEFGLIDRPEISRVGKLHFIGVVVCAMSFVFLIFALFGLCTVIYSDI